MTGNNEMSLNTATMIAALQFYFDSVVFAPGKSPEVTGITTSNRFACATQRGSCAFTASENFARSICTSGFAHDTTGLSFTVTLNAAP